MTIKITPAVPQKIPEEDQKEQIQGQTGAQAPEIQAPVADKIDLKLQESRPPAAMLLDETPSVISQRPTGVSDVVQIKAANKQVADGGLDPGELDVKLKAMAAGMQPYSIDAQDQFISYLETRKASPAALTQVARTVRNSTYKADMKLGRLRKFMSDRGVKLYGNEKIPEGTSGVCLNLTAFRSRLKELEKDGGVIDKRAARELIGTIKDVVDERDLMEAQWLVKRRVYEGKLRFAGTDEKADTVDPYQERFFRLIDEKLDGNLNPKEISFLARQARKANFDDASMVKLREAISRCKSNPDALFFAERVIAGQIRDAKNALTRGPRKAQRNIAFLQKKLRTISDPAEAQRLRGRIAELEASIPKMESSSAPKIAELERVNEDFLSFMAPMLAGKLDRRATRKDLLKQFRSGAIDERQVAGLMSACATSSTPEEFAYASMLFHTQAALADTWEELAEAWDKMMENFRQSLSDDTFDANGNVIETAQERRWRKRVNKRLTQEMQNASLQVQELATRAQLQSLGSKARQELPQAKDATETATLQTQETAFDNEAGDVDLTQTPTV